MYNTPSLFPQDLPAQGMFAQHFTNTVASVCLECSEKIDREHDRKHSLFLLARRDVEENG
jgi:hypothetical protein